MLHNIHDQVFLGGPTQFRHAVRNNAPAVGTPKVSTHLLQLPHAYQHRDTFARQRIHAEGHATTINANTVKSPSPLPAAVPKVWSLALMDGDLRLWPSCGYRCTKPLDSILASSRSRRPGIH